MVITDEDLKLLSQKLNASHAEANRTVQSFSEAVAANARNADGRRLELLRAISAMARRLGVTLPQTEKIDPVWLSKQLVGESIDSRIAFKSALHAAGLLP